MKIETVLGLCKTNREWTELDRRTWRTDNYDFFSPRKTAVATWRVTKVTSYTSYKSYKLRVKSYTSYKSHKLQKSQVIRVRSYTSYKSYKLRVIQTYRRSAEFLAKCFIEFTKTLPWIVGIVQKTILGHCSFSSHQNVPLLHKKNFKT